MNKLESNCHIALMPGFGCNASIFDNLVYPSDNIIKLGWITPLKKESIQSYAERLITPEMRDAKELVLIGHSFGGVIVQEIARIIPAAKIILISSITSKKSLPNGLHLVRNLRLDIWVHKFTMKGTFWIWGKNAGLSGEMKPIFKASMQDYENRYFRWAVKNLAGWKQPEDNNLQPYLIHGTKDTVFPLKKALNPIVVEDGCHLMVYFKADEISEIIKGIIFDKNERHSQPKAK